MLHVLALCAITNFVYEKIECCSNILTNLQYSIAGKLASFNVSAKIVHVFLEPKLRLHTYDGLNGGPSRPPHAPCNTWYIHLMPTWYTRARNASKLLTGNGHSDIYIYHWAKTAPDVFRKIQCQQWGVEQVHTIQCGFLFGGWAHVIVKFWTESTCC